MDANVIALVVIIAALGGGAALFVWNAAGRQPSRTGPSGPVEDRPAGPAAESMAVDDPGEIGPLPQQDGPPPEPRA